MRVLKGYSKDEQKELEEAKDNGFLSTMTLIHGIGDDDDDCHALSEKYYREDPNDNDQMAKDIIDFYCGNAKFPEQKYYVQLIKSSDKSFLNKGNTVFVFTKDQYNGVQTQFTREEVLAIDPRFEPFMEEVEDDE